MTELYGIDTSTSTGSTGITTRLAGASSIAPQPHVHTASCNHARAPRGAV